MRSRRSSGFTLVEMLVVIAIIGMLVALLLPAVQAARESGRRSQCQNNLKQIGLAFHNFQNSFGGFPAIKTDPNDTSNAITTEAARGWTIDILPYLEQAPLRKAYRLSEPYDSANNLTVIATLVAVFQCPSSATQNRTASVYTSAAVLTALSTLAGTADYFPHVAISSEDLLTAPRTPALQINRTQSLAAFTDGMSQTILVDEVAMRPASYVNGYRVANGTVAAPQWAAWGGFAMTKLYAYDTAGVAVAAPLTAACAVNCNNDAGIYAFHSGGANSLFADGSVHFLAQATAARVVMALATRDGNEILGAADF